MMFGIVPTVYQYDGSYYWQFEGHDYVDDFELVLIEKGWTFFESFDNGVAGGDDITHVWQIGNEIQVSYVWISEGTSYARSIIYIR